MARVSQSLQQKLQQRLSPQQIQVVRLLEIPLAQLEQRIKKELEDNPTLEEGEAPESETENIELQDYDEASENEVSDTSNEDEFSVDDYLSDDEYDSDYRELSSGSEEREFESPLATMVSFRDQLLEQLGYQRISQETRKLAEYIIGNLDTDGYLRRNLSALRDDLLLLQGWDVPLEKLEEALAVVQELEPRGIGATTLQQCLLLQLKGIHSKVAHNARLILERCYQRFVQKHYLRIQEELHLSEDDLRAILSSV